MKQDPNITFITRFSTKEAPGGIIFSLFVLLVVFSARPSQACDCEGPGASFLVIDGTIPANAIGVVWHEKGLKRIMSLENRPVPIKKSRFKVELLEETVPRQVQFETKVIEYDLILISPTKKMRSGERYRISVDLNYWHDFFQVSEKLHSDNRLKQKRKPLRSKGSRWKSIEFIVGETAIRRHKFPAKLKLGVLERGKVSLGSPLSCSFELEVGKINIELELLEAASKYKKALLFKTTVDQKPWQPKDFECANIPSGRSWVDVGKELLFMSCKNPNKSSYSLRPGKHKVRMIATLPGVGVIADSGEVQFEIRCPDKI
ncbi:MAG: hypothetical protein JRJ87_21995 [Deltaproteobacteria bacterium]|nr:hypothetical protein [Deltaproteobacteria bacterium]